ncbi:zinc metalloproteinase nas-14-like isoform X2 [Argonauta hians]
MATVRASGPLVLTAAVLLLVLSYTTIGQVSAQSIDEIITEAANSSTEFISHADNGDYKTELDMIFTAEQWREIQRLNGTVDNTRKKRKATRPISRRWTNKIVPYQIRGYFSPAHMAQVNQAIREWNYYTCLSFRPAGSRDRNRIVLQNGGGCSSYVGMIGGAQVVSLAYNCRIKRIIVHELGHAIGFQHEQTRPDRDNYVYILHQNIPGSVRFNFQRYSTSVVNNYGVPYDYTSVMHYGAYAFSTNGRMTIMTKDKRYQYLIGKSPGLSFRDIKLANLMYGCSSRCSNRAACPSGGYRAKDCKCYCPGGSPGQPIKLCSGGGGGGKKDCVDSHQSCPTWASKGECTKNPDYMLVNCKKSCKKCDGGGGGGGKDKECVDKNTNCQSWSDQGECTKNPAYMLINCKKSCNSCTKVSNCVDKNKHCASWAKSGECSANSGYMHPNCPKSCNKCGSHSGDSTGVEPCTDENSHCAVWAQRGECQRNPVYMRLYCKRSCRVCS